MIRFKAVAVTIVLLGSLAVNVFLLASSPRRNIAVQMVTGMGTETLMEIWGGCYELEKAEQRDWLEPSSLWRAAGSMGRASLLCKYAVWAAAVGAPSVIDDGRIADLWPYLNEQESFLTRQAEAIERGEPPDGNALAVLLRSLQEAGFPVRIASPEDWTAIGRAVKSLLGD